MTVYVDGKPVRESTPDHAAPTAAPASPLQAAPGCCHACGRPQPGRPLFIRHRDGAQRVDLADVTVIRHREGAVELWGKGEMLGWIVNNGDTISLARWLEMYPAYVQVSRNALVRRDAVERVTWDTSVRWCPPTLHVEGMEVQVSRRMKAPALQELGIVRGG
jgi:hypothetical protein